MNDEQNEYLGMVARLEAKRAQLDSAIAALRQLAGGEMVIEGAGPSPIDLGGGLRSDAFHGLNMPDAIKKYLRIKKVPQTAREISHGLREGGFKSKAKNLYANVYTGLIRLAEAGEAEKVGDGKEWGLTEWYPGRKDRRPKEAESETPSGTVHTGPHIVGTGTA